VQYEILGIPFRYPLSESCCSPLFVQELKDEFEKVSKEFALGEFRYPNAMCDMRSSVFVFGIRYPKLVALCYLSVA
jgi:hypothetical protein